MKEISLLTLLMTVSISASAANNINIDLKKDFYMHGIVCGDATKIQSFKPQVVITNTGEIEHGTYHYKSNYGPYSYTFTASSNGSDAVLVRETTTKKGSTKDTCIVKELKELPPILAQYVKTDKLVQGDPKTDEVLKNLPLISGMPVNK